MLTSLVLAATIDIAAARAAFEDLDRLCRADAGRLWNVSLCGPTVFADPKSRDAVTWVDGELKAATIPQEIGIANYGLDWDGRRWTMVMWPLPDDPYDRRALLAHESWHRVQDTLGFKQTGPKNLHLDGAGGRAALRLEMRALARALESGSKNAIEDALAFRAMRHALFSGSAEEERLLEMHEGLAEYTGTALAEPRVKERAAHIAKALRDADRSESYMRSFAYRTGPAWGALIEMKSPHWTRSLKPSDDLALVAQRAWKLKTPKDADAREKKYGGAEIRAAEQARAEKKRVLIAELRAKFIDGPTLTVPMGGGGMTFDPYGLQPLGDAGTVYRSITVSGPWGKLEVTSGGGLVSSDWTKVVVPANADGYTLTLNEGWSKVRGARDGDLTVGRSSP